MAYSSLAVANYFLNLARKSGEALTPLKLQKLVYFAHGWHLANTGQPLISEPVERWRFGPVIPSIYHEFKRFGAFGITDLARGRGTMRSGSFLTRKEFSIDNEADEETNRYTRMLLDRVWEEYRRFSGVQLSNMTHEPGSLLGAFGHRRRRFPYQRRRALHLRAARGRAHSERR